MTVKVFFIYLLILYIQPVIATSNVSNLFFEQCNWCNRDYTERIVKEAKQVPTSHVTQAVDCPSNTCSQNSSTTNAGKNGGGYELETIKNFTKNSRDIHPVCFLASMIRSGLAGGSWLPSESNYYYCTSANSQKYRASMFYSKGCLTDINNEKLSCEAKEKKKSQCRLVTQNAKRHLSPRRPCLNKDYLNLTANAFNKLTDCFGFSAKDKKYLFSLFNHESSFWLNRRASGSRSRCYGQIKNTVIDTVNRDIYFGIKADKKYPVAYTNGQIYTQATNRCPYLANVLVPQGVLNQNIQLDTDWREVNYENVNPKNTKKRQQAQKKKCRTSQDPYSCLFYSLFNIKQLLSSIETELEIHPDISSHYKKLRKNPKMKRAIDIFGLPFKTNEILVVDFKDKKTNKKKTWVFQDSNKALTVFQNNKFNEYQKSDFKIKKVELFDEEEFKKSFMYYGYNGGNAMVVTHLQPFMAQLKQKIANRYKNFNKNCRIKWRNKIFEDTKQEFPICSQAQRYSKYRSQVSRGASLHSVDLHEEMSEYIQQYNNKMNTQNELANQYNSSINANSPICKKCKKIGYKREVCATCKTQSVTPLINPETVKFVQGIKNDVDVLGASAGTRQYLRTVAKKRGGKKAQVDQMWSRLTNKVERHCPKSTKDLFQH